MGESSNSAKAKYGRTYEVKPKGTHLATVVWLHGIGESAVKYSTIFEEMPCENIKWIFPTAPMQPLTVRNGIKSAAWFDIKGDLSEDGSIGEMGVDATAAYVASFLAKEPPHTKLVVGGHMMGAAASLYSAICYAHGMFASGELYPVKLSAVISFSGWFPCAKWTLGRKIEGVDEAAELAALLPICLWHREGDRFYEESKQKLNSFGFKNVSSIECSEYGRFKLPLKDEMEDMCTWLMEKLRLPIE